MPKRPISVIIISCLFIITGIVGAAYHVREINAHDLFAGELIWPLLVRLLAVVGGVFLFRGANWARWLLIAWLVFHVALSYFHSMPEIAMHVVLLAVISFFLFRPEANEYFKGASK